MTRLPPGAAERAAKENKYWIVTLQFVIQVYTTLKNEWFVCCGIIMSACMTVQMIFISFLLSATAVLISHGCLSTAGLW